MRAGLLIANWHRPRLTAATAVTSPARLRQPATQPQPSPPSSAAHSHGPPARGKAETIWPMVSATASANRQQSGQPIPTDAPPTLQKPTEKDVMPPDRMQMVDIAMAQLANGPISRGGAGWSPTGGGKGDEAP